MPSSTITVARRRGDRSTAVQNFVACARQQAREVMATRAPSESIKSRRVWFPDCRDRIDLDFSLSDCSLFCRRTYWPRARHQPASGRLLLLIEFSLYDFSLLRFCQRGRWRAFDRAKIQAYCEIADLGGQLVEAAQEKDEKKTDALMQRIDELEKILGPEYPALFNHLYEADQNSKDVQDILSMFAGLLDQSCPD
jgi:hypothetical protein